MRIVGELRLALSFFRWERPGCGLDSVRATGNGIGELLVALFLALGILEVGGSENSRGHSHRSFEARSAHCLIEEMLEVNARDEQDFRLRECLQLLGSHFVLVCRGVGGKQARELHFCAGFLSGGADMRLRSRGISFIERDGVLCRGLLRNLGDVVTDLSGACNQGERGGA